ncbi:MAG: hypothetical protein ACFKPT_16805 [Gloeotrichia echinulata GP01]
MLNFPKTVNTYLLNLNLQNRSLAYLLAQKDGSLSAWGGKLTEYGVTNLRKGENVEEQVFFLVGLLPLDDFPLFLPHIKTNYGICADIHIFPTQEGDWVLLLDASSDEKRLSLIQQQANEFSLLREKSTRTFKK